MRIDKLELEQKYTEEGFSIKDCATHFEVGITALKRYFVLYSIPVRKNTDKTKRTLSKLKSNKNLGCHTKAYFNKIKESGIVPQNELTRRAKIGKAMTGREVTWGDKIGEAQTGEKSHMWGRTGDKHPRFSHPNEYLLQKLKGMVKTPGEPPKSKELEPAFVLLLTRRFGTYNNALKLIGLGGRPAQCPQKYTDQEIIDFIKLHSKDGFAPTEKEIHRMAQLAVYRFGSYSQAVTLAGLKHQSPVRTGEDNWAWKGGEIGYYGPNWYSQRRHARERDNHTCQLCSINKVELGRNMDVHHKIDFKKFDYVPGENDYYLNANQLNNLISLCYRCHLKITNERQRDSGGQYHDRESIQVESSS